MCSIGELCKKTNKSRNLILRAATNIGLYDPINDKKNIFSTQEVIDIRAELRNITNIKKNKKIRKNNFSSDAVFVDITDEFNYDIYNGTDSIDFEYNALDLFSGAGGVALGMVTEKIKPILNVEIFEEANNTYFNNFNNIINHSKSKIDINEVNRIKKSIDAKEKIDIIFGGFPCQGFSVAGIRSAFDPRNNLYKKMAKIVDELKPKIVVMENVVGLLSMKDVNGDFVIDNIINLYLKMGYKVDYAILNAADYGVAQNRKRIILIGNNINVDNLFPSAILSSDNYVTSKEVLTKYENMEENVKLNHIFTRHTDRIVKKIGKLKFGENMYETFSDAWKKLDPSKPSYTVKENHGGVNIHYKHNRVLTPRELAKLQSFPDSFIFSGNKSKQLIQIGNAVPPLLSKAISICIKKMLKNVTK